MVTIIARLSEPLKGFMPYTWDKRIQHINGYFTHHVEAGITTVNLSIPGDRESLDVAFWLSYVKAMDGFQTVELVDG